MSISAIGPAGNGTGNARRQSELMLRLYPKRSAQLLDALTPRQFTAYYRVLVEYVNRRGVLPDDDKLLAKIAHLKPKDWLELRGLLIDVHGVARVENDYWVDDDQRDSIEYQLAYKERQRAAANSREAKRAFIRAADRSVGVKP